MKWRDGHTVVVTARGSQARSLFLKAGATEPAETKPALSRASEWFKRAIPKKEENRGTNSVAETKSSEHIGDFM